MITEALTITCGVGTVGLAYLLGKRNASGDVRRLQKHLRIACDEAKVAEARAVYAEARLEEDFRELEQRKTDICRMVAALSDARGRMERMAKTMDREREIMHDIERQRQNLLAERNALRALAERLTTAMDEAGDLRDEDLWWEFKGAGIRHGD